MKKKTMLFVGYAAYQGFKIWKQRKLVAKMLKAQVRLSKGESDFTMEQVVEGEDKSPIFDDIVDAIGSVFGACSAGIAYFSNELLEQEKGVREFVYYHEIGHEVLGHTVYEGSGEPKDVAAFLAKSHARNIIRPYMPVFNRVIPMELEADMYAAERMGKEEALAAMELFRKILKDRKYPSATLKELDLRIQHIEKEVR